MQKGNNIQAKIIGIAAFQRQTMMKCDNKDVCLIPIVHNPEVEVTNKSNKENTTMLIGWIMHLSFNK